MKKRKKQSLFDIYSENLAAHFPELTKSFACPLCLGLFEQRHLALRVITEEHVVPEALGGRCSTLTCKPCNNSHGSSIDSHLCEGMHMRDVLEGLVPHVGRFSVDGVNLTADITMPNYRGINPSLSISGRDAQCNPTHVSLLERRGLSSNASGTIHLRFRSQPHKFKAALLRSAYLMMFHYFGYAYLRYPFASALREVMHNAPAASPYYLGIQELAEAPPLQNSVGVVFSPKALRCFVVLLTLRKARERYYAVLLPGLEGEDPAAVYGALKALGEAQLQFHSFPRDQSLLTDPFRLWQVRRIWEQCTSS